MPSSAEIHCLHNPIEAVSDFKIPCYNAILKVHENVNSCLYNKIKILIHNLMRMLTHVWGVPTKSTEIKSPQILLIPQYMSLYVYKPQKMCIAVWGPSWASLPIRQGDRLMLLWIFLSEVFQEKTWILWSQVMLWFSLIEKM